MRACLILCFLIMGAGCSSMDSPPELINKIRPVLTTINSQDGSDSKAPLVGETVTLFFHFLAPEGVDNVTLEVAASSPSNNTLTENELVRFDSAVVIKLGNLNHIIVPSIWQLPTNPDLITGMNQGLATFNYQIKASAEGFEKEINGDFLVYNSPEIPAYSWNFDGAIISLPKQEGQEALSGESIDILAESGNLQKEPVKVGWFTSSGEISNRRSVETKWKLDEEGTHSLIFTVRGKSSRMAAIRTATVNKAP